MTKKRLLSLCCLCLCLISLLSGCGKESVEPGKNTHELPTEFTGHIQDISDTTEEEVTEEPAEEEEYHDIDLSNMDCQAYLDNLRILSEDDSSENTMYSPVSLNAALDIFSYMIEDGEQKDSIRQFIGDRNYIAYKDLSSSGKYTIVNRIWANSNKDLNFDDNYVGPYVYEIDMSDSATATQIKNDYVSEVTHGFINETPTVLEDKVTTDVMNIVYFKDTWFDGDLTMTREPYDFHNADGTTSSIYMMRATSDYYYENDTCYVIPMTYESGMTFYAVYPKGNLEDVNIIDIFDNYVFTEADINIPEFEASSVFDVDEKAETLGFKINGSVPNYYDGVDNEYDITQVTRIKVDHEGTEAAGVTEIMTKDNAAPMEEKKLELTFDKPFYYLIGDVNNDVAFIGQVMNVEE